MKSLKKYYLIVLFIISAIAIFYYYEFYKKTTTFNFDSNKGFQMVLLNTDGPSDDMFSTVVCEI